MQKNIFKLFFIILNYSLFAQNPTDSLPSTTQTYPSSIDKFTLAYKYSQNYTPTNPQKALSILHDIESAIFAKNNTQQIAEFHFQKAMVYYNLNWYDSARNNFLAAIKFQRGLTQNQIIWSNIGLASLAIDYQDANEAKSRLIVAEKTLGNDKNYLLEGLIFEQKAKIALLTEDYATASSLYQKALNQYRSTNDTLYIGKVYISIAKMYFGLNNYLFAIDYVNKALLIFSKINHQLNLAKSKILLGKNLYASTQFADALMAYDEARIIFEQMQLSPELANTYYLMGNVYAKMQSFESGIQHFTKAIQIQSKSNDTLGEIKSHIGLADLQIAQSAFIKAKSNYLTALKLSETSNHSALKIELYEKLAIVSAKLNEFNSAYKYQVFYHSLDRSLLLQKKEAAVASMQEQLKDLIIAYELQKTRLHNENQTKNNKNLNQFFIWITSITLLVLSILVYLHLKFRQKNKLSLNHLQEQYQQLEVQFNKCNADHNKLKQSSNQIFNNAIHNMWEPYMVLDKIANETLLNPNANGKKGHETDNDQLVMALNRLNNVVFWIKNQQAKIELYPENQKAHNLIEKPVQLQAIRSAAKKIELIYNPKISFDVYVDKTTLEFCISNIIENAIKFSTRNGYVMIVLKENPPFIDIIITDNGVGMTKDQINNLFSQRKPYTATGTHGEKGNGLGLQLSKEFIERNFGRLSITSSIAIGTEVIISLPASKLMHN